MSRGVENEAKDSGQVVERVYLSFLHGEEEFATRRGELADDHRKNERENQSSRKTIQKRYERENAAAEATKTSSLEKSKVAFRQQTSTAGKRQSDAVRKSEYALRRIRALDDGTPRSAGGEETAQPSEQYDSTASVWDAHHDACRGVEVCANKVDEAVDVLLFLQAQRASVRRRIRIGTLVAVGLLILVVGTAIFIQQRNTADKEAKQAIAAVFSTVGQDLSELDPAAIRSFGQAVRKAEQLSSVARAEIYRECLRIVAGESDELAAERKYLSAFELVGAVPQACHPEPALSTIARQYLDSLLLGIASEPATARNHMRLAYSHLIEAAFGRGEDLQDRTTVLDSLLVEAGAVFKARGLGQGSSVEKRLFGSNQQGTVNVLVNEFTWLPPQSVTVKATYWLTGDLETWRIFCTPSLVIDSQRATGAGTCAHDDRMEKGKEIHVSAHFNLPLESFFEKSITFEPFTDISVQVALYEFLGLPPSGAAPLDRTPFEALQQGFQRKKQCARSITRALERFSLSAPAGRAVGELMTKQLGGYSETDPGQRISNQERGIVGTSNCNAIEESLQVMGVLADNPMVAVTISGLDMEMLLRRAGTDNLNMTYKYKPQSGPMAYGYVTVSPDVKKVIVIIARTVQAAYEKLPASARPKSAETLGARVAAVLNDG
jgi:hypothetical protein